jgi:hypothetical protein
MPTATRQWHPAARPTVEPTHGDFELREVTLDDPGHDPPAVPTWPGFLETSRVQYGLGDPGRLTSSSDVASAELGSSL